MRLYKKPTIISVAQARKELGPIAVNLTDGELAALINDTEIVIREVLQKYTVHKHSMVDL